MAWLDDAKPSRRKSQCPCIRFLLMLCRNGGNVAPTGRPTIGSSPASIMEDGSHIGDKQSCVNSSDPPHKSSASKNVLASTRFDIRFRHYYEALERNSRSCRSCCDIPLCDPLWTSTHRQSRRLSAKRRRRSCLWCFLRRQGARLSQTSKRSLQREPWQW